MGFKLDKIKSHFLLICLWMITTSIFAQGYKDTLDSKLNQAFLQSELPGFAAIIVNKEGISYRAGLGYADIEKNRSFTPQTIENIGSVSKTFIAVALMKAIELGYFSLETNINDILPFKVINPFFNEGQIKIKHLVTHTSGIIDDDSIYNKSYQFSMTGHVDGTVKAFMTEHGYTGGLQDTTLKSFMYSYLDQKGKLYTTRNFFRSRPGQRSSYSNIGSALAAYLIEVKAGVSFAEFTEKYILKPLKMSQSGWFLNKKNAGQHAIPYYNKKQAFPLYSLITYPDGGLRTSAEDLSKYVMEMMRGLDGQSSLLKKESYDVMFTPNFSINNLPENISLKSRNKGVFWNLYNDGNIGHDGDDPGISSNIIFNQDIGIIFLTNIYVEDRSIFLKSLQQYAKKLTN